MQSKLATWSSEDKARKFDRLLRLMTNKSWLKEAAEITLSSSGAKTAGIDGINKQDMVENIDQHLGKIRDDLLAGTYVPLPVKRIYIPKANGKLRPLGIPSLRDRIVQRAMLMIMGPIWESDFHKVSYGFRPELSVHHAIRTVKLQLQDGREDCTAGRWIVEGDLASYFDTIHHRLLMKCVRKRICDTRFLKLLWKFIKVGCIDKRMFIAASEGVPQGGVISPLLSNIMLNEFDQYLENKYLNKKSRKDRWAWNFGILKQRPIVVREGRQWKPAVAYCRFADDFVVVIKGNKAHAEAIREECQEYLQEKLKLTLNMDKTHITHVNDGFTFLGHRIIRKKGSRGSMRPVTTIPHEKSKNFSRKIVAELSKDYSVNKIDMINRLNRKITGWVNFYQFTDNTATTYKKLDRIIFWKLAHWLARKYKTSIKELMKKWVKRPEDKQAKTWVIEGRNQKGKFCKRTLKRFVASSKKKQFRWTSPKTNPYIKCDVEKKTFESHYREIAIAMGKS
jgi:RNA-directed DNA polymerase